MKRWLLAFLTLLIYCCGAAAQAQWNGFAPGVQASSLNLRVSDGDLSSVLGTSTFLATSLPLTANATNYVYLDLTQSPPKLTVNTTGFPAVFCYKIAVAVTNSTKVTALTDSRPTFNSLAFTPSGGGNASVSGTNCEPTYLSQTANLMNTLPGYFEAVCYPGTPDQQYQACENAARTWVTTGGGTCDASGLAGNPVAFSNCITQGDSSGHPDTVIWPGPGTVWQFGNGGGCVMFTQYWNTMNYGPAGFGQSMFTMENTTLTTNPNGALSGGYLTVKGSQSFGYLQTNNVYYQQHSGTNCGVSSGIWALDTVGSDMSGGHQDIFFDACANDTANFEINPGSGGNQPCCGSGWTEVLVDSGSTGPTACSVLATTANEPNALVFTRMNCNHPKPTGYDWFIQDTAAVHQLTVTLYSPYVEGNQSSDTTTENIHIDGARAVAIYSPRYKCEVSGSTSPFITTTNAYNTDLHVEDYAQDTGAGTCQVPRVVVNNGFSGDTASTFGSLQAMAGYDSLPPNYESLNVLQNITVPEIFLNGATTAACGVQALCANSGSERIGASGGFYTQNYYQANAGSISGEFARWSCADDGSGGILCDFASSPASNEQAYYRFNKLLNSTANSGIQIFNGDGSTTIHDQFSNNGGDFINGTLKTNGFQYRTPAHVLLAPTVATISGFGGTGAAISQSNGGTVTIVNVGTVAPGSSGTVNFTAANTGWGCTVYNLSAHLANRADDTVETGYTTATITIQNQTKSTGAAVNWTANDTIVLTGCFGF